LGKYITHGTPDGIGENPSLKISSSWYVARFLGTVIFKGGSPPLFLICEKSSAKVLIIQTTLSLLVVQRLLKNLKQRSSQSTNYSKVIFVNMNNKGLLFKQQERCNPMLSLREDNFRDDSRSEFSVNILSRKGGN
jgi:hypothetical protein